MYFTMVTVPHKMVGLERMSDYRGNTLQNYHYVSQNTQFHWVLPYAECTSGIPDPASIPDPAPIPDPAFIPDPAPIPDPASNCFVTLCRKHDTCSFINWMP